MLNFFAKRNKPATPEPPKPALWRISETRTDGELVRLDIIIPSNDGFETNICFYDGSFDIARRILVCVNACSGAPTGELERHGFLAMRTRQVEFLELQRDHLLNALAFYADKSKYKGGFDSDGDGRFDRYGYEILDDKGAVAEAAIASAKGDQA